MDVSSRTPRYEIVLVGSDGVGKTSIYKRLHSGTFTDKGSTTIGVDCFDRRQTLPSTEEVKVRVWDTCGQERYNAVTDTYYRNKHAIVFVCSVDLTMSHIQLRSFIDDATSISPNALCVFVCNKVDLENDFQSGLLQRGDVDEYVSAWTQELERNQSSPPLFFRTSAKTGEGIDEALEKTLVTVHEREMIRRRGELLPGRSTGQSLADKAPRSGQSAYYRDDDLEGSITLHNGIGGASAKPASGRSRFRCPCWK